MPIKGGRYRVKTTESGKKVRLHITKSGEVDEAVNMKTGARHTKAEFQADTKRKARRGKGK